MNLAVSQQQRAAPRLRSLATTFDALHNQLAARLEKASRMLPLGADRVSVGSIKTAPALFAARSSGRRDDHGDDQGHARELERALRAKPEDAREFDPITVYEIDGEDFCVDGHHRLAVYRKVLSPAKHVPVVRIGGTLADAIAASVRANSGLFLQMNYSERQEAAWKLVKIGYGSKREQSALSGVGETFIAKLRRLKRHLQEHHGGKEWGSLWEAERLVRGTDEDGDEWTEEMEAAKVAEYARLLRRALGSRLHQQTDTVIAALISIIGTERLAEAVRQNIAGDELSDFRFEHDEDDDDLPF